MEAVAFFIKLSKQNELHDLSYYSFRIKASRVLKLFTKLILNILIAPITIAKVSARVYGETPEQRQRWWPYSIFSVGLFSLWIGLLIVNFWVPGVWAIGWFFYMFFVYQVTSVRLRTRELYGITGNGSEDLFASMFLYPFIATQLDETTMYQ